MALSFEDLQTIIKGAELNFFVHPQDPVLMVGVNGYTSHFQFTVNLMDEGSFLQFRSVNYLGLRNGHPHDDALRRLLLELNYQYRIVKFAWDIRDGEVAVYADLFLADNTPTPTQVTNLMWFFVSMLDRNHPRIKQVIETGADPGEIDPEQLRQQPAEDTI